VIQGKRDNASVEELTALGLTTDKVHPITCAICHNPHDAGNSFRSNTEKVPARISRDARMHPAEFGSNTGGREALCIICHSTGSGPHNDSAISVVKSDIAPHAAQADVLSGQNAFFVETGKNKSHSRIEDACIWCHMKPVPKKSNVGYPRGGVNHTFKTSSGLCFRCHKEFEGEELMVSMERDMENLKSAIQNAVLSEIKRKPNVKLIRAVDNTKDVVLKFPDIRGIELVEFRGDLAVAVTAGRSIYEVPLSRINPGNAPLVPTPNGQVIAKAAWNYFLLRSDSSRGAHNPQFVSDVLESTMTKLKALRS
jgi:formate-dependent nitrite reductase cytochrome c552 subunit